MHVMIKGKYNKIILFVLLFYFLLVNFSLLSVRSHFFFSL